MELKDFKGEDYSVDMDALKIETGTETLPDGRIIHGQPTNIRAPKPEINVKELKEQMYADFLDAKEMGKIPLMYKFDNWIRDSLKCLREWRKVQIQKDWEAGILSVAGRNYLEEMRVKMIEVIQIMNVSDKDQYGIQYVDASARNYSFTDGGILVPTHRTGVVKPSGSMEPKKIITTLH